MSENATHIRIFDTTLRDGEQSPGASMNTTEKLEIARYLEALGADIIEAGFPITSTGDFEAVRDISHALETATVAGLARCVKADIDRAGEALRGAPHPRIHVFCATSKIHLQYKLKKAIDEIIRLSVESVKRACQYTDNVEFSPEDGSRTELDVLVDITAAVVEAGATTVNIPDTVGYAVPEEYGHLFAYVREKLPMLDAKNIYLSAHCHNDLGLAVANSIAAVQNGCRQVECTINGIGERAGNAALEEIVMALRTRQDYYGRFITGIQTKKIFPLSRMVSTVTGLQVQRNKAIVGENAFAHEAGIHQHGMLQHRRTYEIMNPEDVGIPASKLVLGKHSGRHALANRLEELGYALDQAQLETAYNRFKELADKNKDVFDEDLDAIVVDMVLVTPGLWELDNLQVTAGTDVISTATVRLRNRKTGETIVDAATGDGPVDAAYSAVQRITGICVKLKDYGLRAITGGKDAQGEVTVQVQANGHTVRGRGVSTDIVVASARAYIAAINRTLARETNGAGQSEHP